MSTADRFGDQKRPGSETNKKRIAFFSGILILVIILAAGLGYLNYRNSHSVPFERNGTKQAVLFLEQRTDQARTLEYTAVTEMTVDGRLLRPVFRSASFTVRVEVAWFREQDIIKPNNAQKSEMISTEDGITEIWLRLRKNGADSHQVPSVDLSYFFARDNENEIVRIIMEDWKDGKQKTWWTVTGTEDVEQARRLLEDFLKMRRRGEFEKSEIFCKLG